MTVSVFDKDASTYDQWYTTPLGKYADEVETICALDLLKPSPGMRILDVGCGTGNFSLKLARLGCNITGIDISEKMLTFAREKAQKEQLPAEFMSMDASDLEFPEEVFDAVVSMAALEFMQDQQKTLDEMFRVLKKGGKLLVGTINRESDWGEMYLGLADKKDTVFRHARLRTFNELKILRPSEFEAVKECLFVPPDAEIGELCEDCEKKRYRKGRGGFLCVLWKKR